MESHDSTTSRPTRLDVLLVACLAAALPGLSTAGAERPTAYNGLVSVPRTAVEPTDVTYLLETFVNDLASGRVMTCHRHHGRWSVRAQELSELGLRTDDLHTNEAGVIALDSIPGLAYRYDAPQQRLYLTVLASRYLSHVVTNRAMNRAVDSSAGALFNYDVVAERQSGDLGLRAYTEQRLFGGWGVFRHTGVQSMIDGHGDYVRLDTSWTRADPDTLRTATAGDFVTRSLAWSRSVRLAGIQIQRNFSLRPDLVTYPVALLSGEAAVPSTVDVYVNQVRQFSDRVPPGPFRIDAPPALTGAGQATVVVTDALGRDTYRTIDLYVVPEMLAEGISDYSLEAGVIRRGFGTLSSDYGKDVVGSASFRYGLEEWLTLESHAEAARGFFNLGVGDMLRLGRLGQVNGSISLSHADETGHRLGLGYRYVSPWFTFTVDTSRASREHLDLPGLAGDREPARQTRVFFGTRLSPVSYLSASFLGAKYRQREFAADGLPPDDTVLDFAPATRLVSLGFRRRIGRDLSLSVNAFRDMDNASSDGIYVSFHTALGTFAQLQGNYGTVDDHAGLSLTRRSPYDGGWDWSVRGNNAGNGYFEADTLYSGSKAAVSLDWSESDGTSRWLAGARGALAYSRGNLVPGRYVQDEFAIVSTSGVGGVPILHENRPVGVTDANGLLLLSRVNAYEANTVSLDPLAIPFGYLLNQATRVATPGYASGALVRFSIENPRTATLALVDANGELLEAGSRGTHRESGDTLIVGYDGIIFVPHAGLENRIRMVTSGRACESRFRIPADFPRHADIGTVVCR